MIRLFWFFALWSSVACAADPEKPRPVIIGHRGLFRDAPENTLASFAACLDLRFGFELDVRRSKDGHLVVMHDATVDRTTDGKGKVSDLTLAEIQKLDAGRWFDPSFAGQRVPSFVQVFALLKERGGPGTLVAMDVKIDDETVETDMVRLAEKHGVLDRLVFIGRTIEEPAVRKRLKVANAKANVCVLAQKRENLEAALDDEHGDWVYARFIPTPEEVARIRKAGKKLFLSGPPVNQHQPDNFRRALEIGADTLLTDFPLDCRRLWREAR